jgi:dTDP-4-amino-4,6-dideoxygalactose transaminase
LAETWAAPPLRLPSDQDHTGRTLGDDELAALADVIASGTLTSTKGKYVTALEQAVADRLGVSYAVACSSGTAAVHGALAALDLEPGDEVITTSITDMGALAPILYQGAIPVFADVDETSLLITADTASAVLSDRTRAIVATHLFGAPCDLREFRALCEQRSIALIEDSAQAWLAESDGQLAGTVGALGCFSLQQGKHLTTGEGGVIVTNDAQLARRTRLWVNKAWPYGEPDPDHEFLALNARLSELQGAVGYAQFRKLDAMVDARAASASICVDAMADIPGVTAPKVRANDRHTYWKLAINVDPDVVPGGTTALGSELRLDGVASAPRYIQKPAFATRVFVEQRTFGSSRWPFTLARPDAVDYSPSRFPGTLRGLDRVLVLPWNERYGAVEAEQVAASVRTAVERLRAAA